MLSWNNERITSQEINKKKEFAKLNEKKIYIIINIIDCSKYKN